MPRDMEKSPEKNSKIEPERLRGIENRIHASGWRREKGTPKNLKKRFIVTSYNLDLLRLT